MPGRHPVSADQGIVPSSTTVMADELPATTDGRSDAFRLGWLLFWMSGTLISFILAAVSVRALSNSLNAFEMMSVRSAGGLAILLVMGLARPQLLRSVAVRQMRMQFVRNAAHFGSQICWTMAIMLLPFATVFALEFTIPAWVTVLAVLFLGERMTLTRASALAICFVGVVVILRPGLEAFKPAALVMIGVALLFAIAAVITKKLVVTESTFSIMLWMNLMQLPMNLAGSDPLFILRLDHTMAVPLIGIAVAGLAIHYCLTNAFRYGDAMIVVPMDFLRVPLIAVIGWIFYGERVDVFVFAGAAIIIAGVLWNIRGETQRELALKRLTMQPAE
jgi:drug/metabolite transporter (DMT)-like permease